MCLRVVPCSIVHMAESSSSFIPKRSGTTNRPQPTRRGNFFALSVVSYALFVAAPLASGVVFVYDKYVQKQFAQTVINLDSAIKGFSEADMQRVTEFDERLTVANSLLDSHVSFGTLFSILEASTAATVQFDNLKIERVNNDTLHVSAAMSSDAFDALLFQRAIYAKDQKIAKAGLSNIKFTGSSPVSDTVPSAPTTAQSDGEKKLSLSAKFIFSASQISYNPEVSMVEIPLVTTDVVEINETATSSSSIIATTTNQTSL